MAEPMEIESPACGHTSSEAFGKLSFPSSPGMGRGSPEKTGADFSRLKPVVGLAAKGRQHLHMSVEVYAAFPRPYLEPMDPASPSCRIRLSEEALLQDRAGWRSLPETMMALVLQRLSPADTASVRLACADWYETAGAAISTLRPLRLEVGALRSRFRKLQALDLGQVAEQVTAPRLMEIGQGLRSLTTLNLGRHHRMIVSSVNDHALGALSGMPKLSTLNLAQCVHITDDGLCLVARGLTDLTSLNISGCVQVTDAGMGHLARLPRLRALEIPWCLKITDTGLKSLAPLRCTLSHLNLSGCQLVTEIGVSSLCCLTQLTNLTVLHLGYANPAVTDVTLGALRPLSKLESLSLSGLQLNATRVTDHGIACIAASFASLRHLNLMWLNVSDAGCAMLATLQGLQSLSLRGCHRITAVGVARLSTLTNLEALNLLNLPEFNVSDAALRSLVPLQRLTSLSLGDTHLGNNATDSGLAMLASFRRLRTLSLWWMHWGGQEAGLVAIPALTELRSLDLQGCINVRDASLSALSQLSSLRSLQLCRCTKITDAGLLALAPVTSLTNLNLCSCYRITDVGLQRVAQIRGMQVLNLDGCYEITDSGVAALAPLTALQVLNLSCCERVSGIGFLALRGCSQLTSLNLTCCSFLNDAGLASVSGFPSMTKLDLCQCVEISDAGLESLSKLTALTGLDLAFCPKITDGGVEEPRPAYRTDNAQAEWLRGDHRLRAVFNPSPHLSADNPFGSLPSHN
eukprot:CAMPEP_0177586400 /NCGR_PEP_ID=MMETSP0419_2-20121207/5050_1 /TAXON_ID=582737 /ORGANISM="Tetraselmis sp., Strain GSL018" /LENGTH=744 /DNA_ID=CAMNT_0019076285 /DNA_START=650 /DNA_END=2883 /DNA_ORIENTATION=+